MSSYSYSSLPESGENIRLLLLLPSEDEAAPLHCELRDYSLRRSTSRAHLYEAVSYVWGDPNNTLPIFVDKRQFQVTVNLHAALLRLRDHSFERILWVDAICINQNNDKERRQQVQLMARIYNSASRVVVWLGEEIEEIKGVLEDIQVASNEKPGRNSKEVVKKEHIIKFLQNPWFQRIWVLQEVAVAQHVVIMCGSITIAGSAFCAGVKSLELSYTDSPELQTLPSVIEIIERAGLQPKFKANSQEIFSLKIRSLAELIDMFHIRQATDRRDKVYALLGMSSEDPEKAGLQPNYETSWEEVLQQLVKFILGIKPNIYTKYFGEALEWTLQASAKPIQEHDIICLLDGASKPSIIRLCKDHFAVVVIAATPLNVLIRDEWPQISRSKTQFLRDFVIIWDWESSYGNMQHGEEYETLAEIFRQASLLSRVERVGPLGEATRLWNDIAILNDLGEYEKAGNKLIDAQDEYSLAWFRRNPSSHKSKKECGRTILAFAAGEGHKDIVKMLLDTIHPDVKDGRSGRTPLWHAADRGHEAVVEMLLATGQVDAESKDYYGRTPLSHAARKGHESVVKLLLATNQIDADSKDCYQQTPLSKAAKEGHESVVKLLIATDQVEVDSKDKKATDQAEVDLKDEGGQTPYYWAAMGEHEAILELILAASQRQAESGEYKIEFDVEPSETSVYESDSNGDY
ncbi:uncharacterized protein EAE97_004917 [Botrytis byssoidea]|uniref:Heterokaryon incompatibility domain-containing protein n=1 Tax=Botrytis byssoidea TaxID=139641 RepID=A0A9P5ILH0_9HELO|nr:uncharacterized protein EAE97_004917 [Botrytis byssoidea]KAF7945879.1 hypothetical protein EAE97_004917 [Botrytis byssoidea]